MDKPVYGFPLIDRYCTWDPSTGSGQAQGSLLPVVLQEKAVQYGVPDRTIYNVYGLDLLYSIEGSTPTYYLTDGLGSTTDVRDASGGSVDSYTYDVFGAIRSGGSSGNQWLFTGQQRDRESGFYYLRARYYVPEARYELPQAQGGGWVTLPIGRFLSRDPIPFIQRYAYVGNNPVNLSDPYGYFPPSPGDIAGGLWDAGRCAANPVACAKSKVDEVLVDPLLGSLPGGGAIKCVYHHGAARCAAEWALGELGFDRSYVDLNVTGGCGGVVTAGTQLSLQSGIHIYGGGGLSSSCGIAGSITVAPRQSISSGPGCGVQGSYLAPINEVAGIGPTVQVGAGGLGGKQGGTFFQEYGLSAGAGWNIFGPVGVAGTCYYVWP